MKESPRRRPATGARPLWEFQFKPARKTFAVDNERVFVGSFNIDPRSVNLNTELGFVIDSPTLARQDRYGLQRQISGQAM
jgi:phosphatidylserine/phosphatidylglycerophosphate/cardiolipin synthase-like enzyme